MGSISRMNTIIIIGLAVLVIVVVWYMVDLSGGKAMVIVEPRKHDMLKFVCENFDKNMCKSWDLYVFHGKSYGDFAAEAVSGIKDRRIFLKPLEEDNLTAGGYNTLFKSLEFWDQVKAENILVFQTDAVLCPASKYKIQDFMKYDYIGCASYHGAIGNSKEVWAKEFSKGNSFYGVGGLSFRKNSFQKQCIRDYPGVGKTYPEDVFYSNCLEKSPNKPAEAVTLSNFCTQDTFDRRSFGAHKTWYMKKEHKKDFFEFCPAAREIKKD